MSDFLQDYKLDGTELEIITFPAPVLKQVATEVMADEFNADLELLCRNMLYTMYHAPGIGLAAPQVGISKRIFVLDVDFEREKTDEEDTYTYANFKPMIIINPKFIEKNGEITYQEGCLSVPGIYEDVKRFQSVKIEYQNLKGEKQTLETEDLRAICLQHENDHLDGILFIEKLSKLKMNFFKKKLIKEKRK